MVHPDVFGKERSAEVVATKLSRYALIGTIRNHVVMIDEPAEFGGSDYGPDPMEMVALSLAACISLTIKMYAERRKWDIGAILVKAKHTSVTLADGKRQGKFLVSLTSTVFDESIRGMLDAVADKCPVHNMLHGSCIIERVWTWLDRPGEKQGFVDV